MRKCNLCGSSELLPLIDFGDHPVAKRYLSDRLEMQPTWPIKLYFCKHCGLTQLVDSCPPDVLYENYVTLSSWKFQPHMQHEIDVIKSLEGIGSGAKIIEIGSNDGTFLQQMSLSGFENILGVEPAKDAYDVSMATGINTLQAFLTPDLSLELKDQYGEFDVFVSRQNLEHISDLQGVAKSIQTLVKPHGHVLIEVPNFSCNLRCWDYSLWEEHVNYFTLDTLQYFLALAGVELTHQEIFLFSGESIFVIGRKVGDVTYPRDYVRSLHAENIVYANNWPNFRSKVRGFLDAQRAAKKTIAVYGAGARVFCLMNFSGIYSYIDLIVDDQPEKQNKFMPGGKIPIVPSDALSSESIDICLLGVNTENEDKVISKHDHWVCNGGVFWSLLPPSSCLLPVWEGCLQQ